MGFFDIFRQRPPIRDAAALTTFIDENAALLVQRGIYEYARARAGVYAKILFTEKAFLDSIEFSRWRAYPLGLAMVAELTEGILRPHWPHARHELTAELRVLTLDAFDRYDVPPGLGASGWSDAREELARLLDHIGLHATKPAKDIPEPFAERYFDLMPIHERLRTMDFPSVHAYLKVSLCNMHDELSRRLDVEALLAGWERRAVASA